MRAVASRWRGGSGLRRALALIAITGLSACDTVDPGQDFSIADTVYDPGYFYCKVEPVLFNRRCGPGDSGAGDATGGCHFNVTSFRLSDYAPLVADSCGGTNVPGVSPPQQAQANLQISITKMNRDPDLAPLILRPTGVARHPRVVFDSNSPEADAIRVWALQFSQ